MFSTKKNKNRGGLGKRRGGLIVPMIVKQAGVCLLWSRVVLSLFFTLGGLGFSLSEIGISMAIIGVLLVPLTLLLFPMVCIPTYHKTNHVTVFHAWDNSPHPPVTLAKLMRLGIGRNASCTVGDFAYNLGLPFFIQGDVVHWLFMHVHANVTVDCGENLSLKYNGKLFTCERTIDLLTLCC